MDGAPAPPPERRHPGFWLERVKRVGLAALMAVVTLNIWTGSPLLGLWVGSRAQGSGPPTMAAVAAVAATMAAVSVALIKLLTVLDAAYNRLVGRSPTIRRHLPWLRSLRAERPHEDPTKRSLSALEVILVVSVVVAVALFEIWFFFFSASPIDQRSGRD